MSDAKTYIPNIIFRDAQLIFKPNFDGHAERFNAPGRRYMNIRLDDDLYDQLDKDGWRVKVWQPKPTDEDPEPDAIKFMKVIINLDGMVPPKIVSVKGTVKTVLEGDLVNVLQGARFSKIKCSVSPYQHEEGDPLTGYLRTGYFYLTDMDDPFMDDDFEEDTNNDIPF